MTTLKDALSKWVATHRGSGECHTCKKPLVAGGPLDLRNVDIEQVAWRSKAVYIPMMCPKCGHTALLSVDKLGWIDKYGRVQNDRNDSV
jgi:RNase P subunit RPR2